MTCARVDFFYDIVSPYSYLASTQLAAIASRTNAVFNYRPMFLGGVMKATGNVPPATLPARAPYLLRDLSRWAKRYGVPLQMPRRFPQNTAIAGRVLGLLEGAERVRATDMLFAWHWAQGKDLDSTEQVVAALSALPTATELVCDAKGWEGKSRRTDRGRVRRDDEGNAEHCRGDATQPSPVSTSENPSRFLQHTLVSQAESDEAKAMLRSSTDEAISRGAFGAPTFFLNHEMFFGNDRLLLLEDALADIGYSK